MGPWNEDYDQDMVSCGQSMLFISLLSKFSLLRLSV